MRQAVSGVSFSGVSALTGSCRFCDRPLQRWLLRFGPHPVEGSPHRGLLHEAPLEAPLAWKVEQHQPNQDGRIP